MAGRNEADHDGSALAQEIGDTLKGFRVRAGMLLTDLADVLSCSTSKISRLEGGFRGLTELDAILFLANCGASLREIEALLKLVRQQDDPYHIRPHGEQLPDQLRSLIVVETQASSIIQFEPLIIPGILQIEPYARAAFEWHGRFAEDDIQQRVKARMARQQLLRRTNPPVFTFYIQERVLRTKIAEPAVMHEQLLHLVLTSSDRCAIRVITEEACPAGVLGSPFRVMRFTDGNRPIAYTENQAASVFLESPADLEVFRDRVTRIAGLALDGGQSREWLATLASEYDRVKGDTA